MRILVLLKQVPDLVEELEIDESGKKLNTEWMKYVLSEYDDHALEQALLLKEKYKADVDVFCIDQGSPDETLFTASAKGATSVTKVRIPLETPMNGPIAAFAFQKAIGKDPFDLILTGVQAIDDIDGGVGPWMANLLDIPYIGVVRGIVIDEATHHAIAGKEYPGGILAQMKIELPCVLGIQAAEQPPRYIPIAKIRQAMKTTVIKEDDYDPAQTNSQIEQSMSTTMQDGGVSVGIINFERIFKPTVTGGAEILSGTPEEITLRIVDILFEKGIVR